MYLDSYEKYVGLIKNSSELKEIWNNYQNKNEYARDISWTEIIYSLEYLMGPNA